MLYEVEEILTDLRFAFVRRTIRGYVLIAIDDIDEDGVDPDKCFEVDAKFFETIIHRLGLDLVTLEQE